MDWIRATYGFRFVAEDLSPNLGCFWYFFTEMFDNFRDFFLFAFDYFPVVLCVPVVVRLGADEPLFCVFVARLLCVVFSPYPTLGDASGYLALLPLFRTQLAGAEGIGYLVAPGTSSAPCCRRSCGGCGSSTGWRTPTSSSRRRWRGWRRRARCARLRGPSE